MMIRTQDGRQFGGTALQIVQQMRALSCAPHLSLEEYAAWVARNAKAADGAVIVVAGDDDESRARSLIDALVSAGLATAYVVDDYPKERR